MSEPRKVKVYRNGKLGTDRVVEREFSYVGDFLGFTSEYEELRDGVGQYPVAIVEKPSGEVETVLLRNLEFAK